MYSKWIFKSRFWRRKQITTFFQANCGGFGESQQNPIPCLLASNSSVVARLLFFQSSMEQLPLCSFFVALLALQEEVSSWFPIFAYPVSDGILKTKVPWRVPQELWLGNWDFKSQFNLSSVCDLPCIPLLIQLLRWASYLALRVVTSWQKNNSEEGKGEKHKQRKY